MPGLFPDETMFGRLPSGVIAPKSVSADMLADGAVTSRAFASEAWTAYSPINVNVTVGNGTQTARYTKIGRIVFWSYHLKWGSTTSFPGTIQIGLPVAASADTPDGASVGSGNANDAGTGNRPLSTFLNGTGGSSVYPISGITTVAATTPHTWASGDHFSIAGSYEAAS